MLTIHHLAVSQSERVIWLMEELGLPYDLRTYDRDPVTSLAPPVFLELHPLGSAPVIEDEGVTLAESQAIFAYILALYGEGRLELKPGEPGFADYLYWFHYANAGLMPQMMNHLIQRMDPNPGANPLQAVMKERMNRHLGMIDTRLAEVPYLAGKDFTAADILLHFPFGTMSAFAPVDISGRPFIRQWLDRISERPAYKRAMAAAGHASDPAAMNS